MWENEIRTLIKINYPNVIDRVNKKNNTVHIRRLIVNVLHEKEVSKNAICRILDISRSSVLHFLMPIIDPYFERVKKENYNKIIEIIENDTRIKI